jgi:hypothetical protein
MLSPQDARNRVARSEIRLVGAPDVIVEQILGLALGTGAMLLISYVNDMRYRHRPSGRGRDERTAPRRRHASFFSACVYDSCFRHSLAIRDPGSERSMTADNLAASAGVLAWLL